MTTDMPIRSGADACERQPVFLTLERISRKLGPRERVGRIERDPVHTSAGRPPLRNPVRDRLPRATASTQRCDATRQRRIVRGRDHSGEHRVRTDFDGLRHATFTECRDHFTELHGLTSLTAPICCSRCLMRLECCSTEVPADGNTWRGIRDRGSDALERVEHRLDLA